MSNEGGNPWKNRGGGGQNKGGGGGKGQRGGGGGGDQNRGGGGGGQWQQQSGGGGSPHRGGGGQHRGSGGQQHGEGSGGGGGQHRGGGGGRGGQQRGGGGRGGQQGGGGRGDQHYEAGGGGGQHYGGGGQGGGGGRGRGDRGGGGGQHYGGGGQRGGGGRGRGDRGGGRGGFGGGRGRGHGDPQPKVFYEEAKSCPDPYEQPISKTVQNDQGWKKFPDKQDDVVLHKKNPKDIPKWNKKLIDTSVNHFLIQSLQKPGLFPFPTAFHYDISYEIERKRRDQKPPSDPKQQQPQQDKSGGGGKGKGGRNKRKQRDSDVGALTKQMGATSLAGPSGGGGGGGDDGGTSGGGPKPPAKKLPKHLTNAILDYLIPEIRKKYKHFAIATDGSFNLYTTRRFEHIPIPMQHDVTFADLRKAGLTEDEDDAIIKVLIQPTIDKATGEIHTIDTSTIAKWFQNNKGSLQGFNFSAELRQTLEAACNAFVKCMPNFRYISVGRSTMVPSENPETHVLGGGLVAWKGISANIAMGWKPYLNVDIANCAFILDKNVMSVIEEIFYNPDTAYVVNKWSHREYDEVRGLLRTCKVSYKVDGQKRSGPIRDVVRKTPKTHRFRWEEKNKDVSVLDYYRERYGVILECPDAPLLEIRKKGTYVPAELCTIKKGQSYNRKLDGNQTTQMLDFARKDPDETKVAVETRMKEMKLKDNAVLQSLGVKVADEMLKVKARVLVPPTIRYGCQQNQPNKIAHVSPTDGTWDAWKQSNFNFYKTQTVNKWGILVVGCPKFQGPKDPALSKFADCMIDNGRKKGVMFTSKPHPIVVDKKNRRNCSAMENSKDIEKYFLNDFQGCEIVICVFPRKGDPLYGHIKHAAEVSVGILTQCVAERNIMDRFGAVKDATLQNILFKINSKLGGINHVTVAPFDKVLAQQFCTLLMDCPVMVLGADVTHAPPGSKKTLDDGMEWIMPSYSAVTGSLDRTCMPFMTEVRAQRKANAGAAEVIQQLDDIVENMLKNFFKTSGMYPVKIIYFRDGVGEGQFPEVLHIEMNAIRVACKRIDTNYQPKITFITVQKRHKTRIFWDSPNGIDNAPAGTVIDQEIVHPSEIDFYLLSHKGLLGTSRPSRYHVLWDDSDLTQDQLQSLAYTLCYMYARCTKSVKMPAPTYYAHLAADRAKKLCEGFETKHGPPSEENLNKMLKRKLNFINRFPMHFI